MTIKDNEQYLAIKHITEPSHRIVLLEALLGKVLQAREERETSFQNWYERSLLGEQELRHEIAELQGEL